MIHEFKAPVSVHTPLGQGDAFLFVDYGIVSTGTGVNSVWVVRLHHTGVVKHFFSEDIRIYGNPMDGRQWDVEIPADWTDGEDDAEKEGPIRRMRRSRIAKIFMKILGR